jgi:hypothetical protein
VIRFTGVRRQVGRGMKVLWRSVEGGVPWEIRQEAKDGLEIRYLVNGDGRMQSGIAAEGGKPVPMFRYAQAMVAEGIRGGHKSILMLGAGGFSIPTCITAFTTATKITVVDTEAWLEGVAKTHLFKPDTDRIEFVNGDALSHPVEPKELYDLILIDVFSSSGMVPECFFTSSFITRMRRVLRLDGAVVWNVSMGRESSWKTLGGGILSTLRDGGIEATAYCHPAQNHYSRCNVLFAHNTRRSLGEGGWVEFECPSGVAKFSEESPLVWPERTLANRGGVRPFAFLGWG